MKHLSLRDARRLYPAAKADQRDANQSARMQCVLLLCAFLLSVAAVALH